LATTTDTAALILECSPEHLATRQAIFAGLLATSGPDTVLANASSAIPASHIVPDPALQTHVLVAHPVNPPAVLRLIELCPAPGTMDRAAALFACAGFAPICRMREVEGFVLNRLRGAVLREAYRLVGEGITDVAGIAAVMRLGLRPRRALSGPFEAAEPPPPAASGNTPPARAPPMPAWAPRAARRWTGTTPSSRQTASPTAAPA
jgi:3-hydroxyacyl-CoA dehydrogenase